MLRQPRRRRRRGHPAFDDYDYPARSSAPRRSSGRSATTTSSWSKDRAYGDSEGDEAAASAQAGRSPLALSTLQRLFAPFLRSSPRRCGRGGRGVRSTGRRGPRPIRSEPRRRRRAGRARDGRDGPERDAPGQDGGQDIDAYRCHARGGSGKCRADRSAGASARRPRGRRDGSPRSNWSTDRPSSRSASNLPRRPS